MGTIFEKLIRLFNEALNENPGEPFTPRDVIRLMVKLLIKLDRDELDQLHIGKKIYDPCCATGGMLTIAKDFIEVFNSPGPEVNLFSN
jgi:type I restriction enzyme M protein